MLNIKDIRAPSSHLPATRATQKYRVGPPGRSSDISAALPGRAMRAMASRPEQSHKDLPMSAKPQIVPPAGIAVIGLGNMGVPMGACLVKAGYGVTGFDLSAAARGRFVAAGGRAADDIAIAVAAADVVITLLPNGK